MAFPFLTIFMIFIVYLAIRQRSVTRKQNETRESFWERESAANNAPAADLDNITYITIPLGKFPLGKNQDVRIVSIEKELEELSKKRLLNLTGKTNTELKETYGVKNLPAMQAIGEDFDRLTILIKDYGEALIDLGQLSDAIAVLEFGAAVKTDISQNYTMLGDCYQALGQTAKITYLMQQVESQNLVLGPSIIRHLKALLPEDSTASDVKSPEDISL